MTQKSQSNIEESDPQIQTLRQIQNQAQLDLERNQRTIQHCKKKIAALKAAIEVKNGQTVLWLGDLMAYYLPRRGVPMYIVWRHYFDKKDEYVINSTKHTIHHITSEGTTPVTSLQELQNGFWYCTRIYE